MNCEDIAASDLSGVWPPCVSCSRGSLGVLGARAAVRNWEILSSFSPLSQWVAMSLKVSLYT